MSRRLYIGNLVDEIDNSDLVDIFSAYGAVQWAEVKEGRGFGFVQMTTEDEASAAMNGINGKELGGRRLKVNEASDEIPRRPRY